MPTHRVHITKVLHTIDANEMNSALMVKHELLSVIDSIMDGKISSNEAVQVLKAYAGDVAEVYEAVLSKSESSTVEKKVYHVHGANTLSVKMARRKGRVRNYMHDSASSVHIVTSEDLIIPGTLRDCDVIISGVNGKSEIETLRATKQGDVRYDINDNEHTILHGVLVAERAQLGDDTEVSDYILVSTSRLTRENNIGVHFVAGGDCAELVRNGRVLHSFNVGRTCDRGMYVDRVKRNKNKNGENVIRVSKSVSKNDPAYHWQRALEVFQMHLDEEESEKESIDVNAETTDADEKCSNEMNSETGEKNVAENASEKENKNDLKVVDNATTYKKKNGKKPVEQKQRENESLKAQEDDAKKGKIKPEARLAEFKAARTAEEKRKFAELIHSRIHNGNTSATLKFLRRAFGDEFTTYMNEVLEKSCDGCAFAKSCEKHPHHESTRKAKAVGERLHFDVFTAPWRSDTGCKYLLVVIDEYSSYIWGFGMRKKSETMMHMKRLIMKLEKQCRSKIVKYIESSVEHELVINTNGSVSALRCDNAGENILERMKRWCNSRGIEIETSVPETPYQNGRAERAGGAVWKGGAAFRHAMYMPDDEWLHCIRAYIHVRNRLPNTSAVFEHTPYEEMFDVRIEPAQLISHFRATGSLCYVHKPKSQQKGKPKKSFRAMMLGYSLDGTSQKGYLVRGLSSGKLQMIPYGRMYKCFELENVYPKPNEYDEWLYKKVRRENKARGSNLRMKERELESDDESNDEQSDNDDNDSGDLNESMEILDPPSGILNVDDEDQIDQTEDQNENDNEDGTELELDDCGGRLCHDDDEREALGMPIVVPSPRMQTRRQLLPVLPDIDEDEQYDVDEDGENGQWEIDKITDYRRVTDDELEYRVQWKAGDVTWEPREAFLVDPDEGGDHECIDAFMEFDAKVQDGEIEEWVASVNEGENVNITCSLPDRESDRDYSYVEPHECRSPDLSELFEDVLMNLSENARVNVLNATTKIKGGEEVPQTRKQAMNSQRREKYEEAEVKELAAFKKLRAWELVPRPDDANVVGVRWVYDHKLNTEFQITRYKARLVAQGYKQVQGVDFNETFAPTMQIKTLRLLLALASAYDMSINQYDVSNAFLHASLDEVVYVAQPEGYEVKGKEGWVYRLKKAMYGLKNAPKAYSDYFMKTLTKLGFEQSKKDECLWTLRKGKSVLRYLFHVDDIVVVSNDDIMKEAVLATLRDKMEMRDEGEPSLFLGVAIEKDGNGGYKLSQRKYIEKMAKRFNIDENARQVTTPSEYGQRLGPEHLPKTEAEEMEAQTLPYQALVGSLIYVSKSRPDVAYAISDVARFMSRWGKAHWKAAVRILRYLYSTRDKCLTINCSPDNLVLRGYVDANWGDARETNEEVDDKWKSQYGYIFFVGDSCVSWVSKRQQSRSASSMEAEYYAAFEGGKEGVWFREIMCELDMKQIEPTKMYEDNKACISFGKNNTNHERTKHIDIKAYYLRDYIKGKIIDLEHIKTDDQLADMLTKMQLTHVFERHTKQIMCGEPNEPTVVKAKRKLPKFMRKIMGKNGARTCNCITCFYGRCRERMNVHG